MGALQAELRLIQFLLHTAYQQEFSLVVIRPLVIWADESLDVALGFFTDN